MRRLWPPAYDDFSIRVWAASFAILLNLVGAVLIFRGGLTDILWWFGFPGAFAFVPVAGGGIEEVDGWRAWCGFAAWLLANGVFYYFVARFFIRLFQPVNGWWPEKRS